VPNVSLSNVRGLPDGLELRSIAPSDAEQLSAFATRIFGEKDGSPDVMAGIWARELVRGDHPTTRPGDGTVVVDSATGRIVSSCFLISQTWTYGGIPFGVGRPEIIATDPAYRNRGLVRAQIEAIHTRSAALGHRVQAISGIPVFYRQFGYEPALVSPGGRRGPVAAVPDTPSGAGDPVRVRPATEPDVPFVTRMYERAAGRSLIASVRDEAIWRHELLRRDPGSDYWHHVEIVEAPDGVPAGLIAYVNRMRDETLDVTVVELEDGLSWNVAAPSLLRALRVGGERVAARLGTRFTWIGLDDNSDHPLIWVAGSLFAVPMAGFAWQVRIADMSGFIRHIAPLLDARLAASPLACFNGLIALSFYTGGLRLRFESGCLTEAEDLIEPPGNPGAAFPGRTFLQLLLGSRSLADLEYAFPGETLVHSDTARLLLETLFPKSPSSVWPVG